MVDHRKHRWDCSHLSSHPSAGLTIWDLNSPHNPRSSAEATGTLAAVLGGLVPSSSDEGGGGETPAEVEWTQQKTEIHRL